MSDLILPKPPGRARGRPFEKGRSGNPGGRRRGSRNKATLAAAALLAGESEALTRKAVEMALGGDAVLHGTRAAAVPRAYRQIQSAADRGRPHGEELRAVAPRRFSGDGRGHFRTRPRRDHAGRGGSRLNLLQILTAAMTMTIIPRAGIMKTEDCDS